MVAAPRTSWPDKYNGLLFRHKINGLQQLMMSALVALEALRREEAFTYVRVFGALDKFKHPLPSVS
jgi:hypothetical protein